MRSIKLMILTTTLAGLSVTGAAAATTEAPDVPGPGDTVTVSVTLPVPSQVTAPSVTPPDMPERPAIAKVRTPEQGSCRIAASSSSLGGGCSIRRAQADGDAIPRTDRAQAVAAAEASAQTGVVGGRVTIGTTAFAPLPVDGHVEAAAGRTDREDADDGRAIGRWLLGLGAAFASGGLAAAWRLDLL